MVVLYLLFLRPSRKSWGKGPVVCRLWSGLPESWWRQVGTTPPGSKFNCRSLAPAGKQSVPCPFPNRPGSDRLSNRYVWLFCSFWTRPRVVLIFSSDYLFSLSFSAGRRVPHSCSDVAGVALGGGANIAFPGRPARRGRDSAGTAAHAPWFHEDGGGEESGCE